MLQEKSFLVQKS